MDKPDTLTRLERRLAPPLLNLAVVLAVSGLVTYFRPSPAAWAQWTILLHALAGVIGSVLLLIYLFIHFRRTIGHRRPVVVITGLLASALFLILAWSGLDIIWEGQTEAGRWIYDGHLWAALPVAVLLAAHLVIHGVFFPARRLKADRQRFSTVGRSALLRQGSVTAALAALVAAGAFAYGLRPEPYRDRPAVKPYAYSYGQHPFRPSQTETRSGGFVDPRRVGGSERCAACHQDIARQWQASMHAQAASDQAYQTNVNLLSEKRGMAATRYCEGCHAPVALLSGQLTQGGRLDTHGHMREGVSCLSCHGIDRIVHVEGVASYRFGAPTPYLFEGEDGALPTLIHNLSIRLQPRQHRADMAKSILATPELCATCHAQFMDKDFNGWGWVKMQDDYLAWLNGPFSGQTHQAYAHAEMRRCQDCHFPKEAGRDPSADANGLVKSHFNIAANTAIPSYVGNTGQLEKTARFLAADRLRVSIDRPNRTDATESSRHIDPGMALRDEAPAYAYLGETVTLKVAVTNVGVGHGFPGGTTDINEAWLHFQARDAQGRTVHESGKIQTDGSVDPAAYFYRSTPIDRYGNAVWRHDLFNMIGDSFKRVIPAGGTDITTFSFRIPDWAKGAVMVTTDLNYRKLNIAYARWALKDDKIELPVVTMATGSLRLPLRIRPEVISSTPPSGGKLSAN